MDFTLTDHPISHPEMRTSMQRIDAGGFCVFEGWVRNHHLGRDVIRLEYEAYARLALKQGEEVLKLATERFDVLDIRAVHRTGPLAPGDLAVWVGVSSVHRKDAFQACQYVIDHIKDTVPIWKHEFYTDGTSEWVDPTACHCSHHPAPTEP